MEYLPYIAIGAVFVYLAFQVVSKGGVKAALLGAGIANTLGEIQLSTKGVRSDLLRVHSLKDGNVGLERTMKAAFGFSTTTITLSPDQARTLSKLLDAQPDAR